MVEGGPTPLEVYRFVRDTLGMIAMFINEFTGAANGKPEGEAATGWRNKVAEEQRRALAACCPQTAAAPYEPPKREKQAEPWDPKLASIANRGADKFADDTIEIASIAARVATERGLPREALVRALMAGFVESAGIHNLDYGHSSSVGWLQLIDTHGTFKQRMDPAFSVGWFYDELVKVPNWRNRPAGEVVQAVQRSGFPHRYAAWQDEAEQLAAQVGGTGPVTPESSRGAADSCGGTPTANVATWNVYVHNSRSDVVGGVRAIAAAGADVIGLQELSDGAERRAVADAMSEFTMVGRDSATPILLRTSRYTILDQKTVVAVPRHQPFEGPRQGARFVVSVTARDSDGRTVSYVNTHMLPKVQKNGELNRKWPQRVGWYRKQLRLVTGEGAALRSKGPVILMGDMNFDGDPDGAFGSAGFTASTSIVGGRPTRKGRDIDHVWSSGATPSAEEILPRFGSDHHPKLVRFAAPGPKAAQAAAQAQSTPGGFNLPGNRTVDQAIQWMAARDGQGGWGYRCLAAVGRAYGHMSTQQVAGHWYATGQWDAMPSQYKRPGKGNPPRGALVFWKTGQPAGHIAISDGNGNVWTTDPPGRKGTIGLAPISEIDKWGPRIGHSSPFFVGRTGSAA